MLTYEILIEQAKIRGLPANKIRGILREYLQILILKEISRSGLGKQLYFLGGTYLRLVHDIKRFSEDLDFNAHNMKVEDFDLLINSIQKELARTGIISKVNFKHYDNLLISNITFPETEEQYGAASASGRKGFMIKVEANCPPYKMETETNVISGFGEIFPIICMKKEYIFADKIDAMIKKNRARHIYDVIFMIANDFPASKKILLYNNIKQNPEEAVLNRINSLPESELQKLALSLRPFLFDEKSADLIINAPVVMRDLLRKHPIKRV